MTLRTWRSAWKGVFVVWLVATAAVALASIAYAAPAVAAGLRASIPTVIHMDPIAPITAGQPFTVTGIFYRHVEGGNAGIPHRGVKLYLESLDEQGGAPPKPTLLATVFSDANGRLRWVVRTPLASGRYRLYYLYQGSPVLRDSVATMELQVLAASTQFKPAPFMAGRPIQPAKSAKTHVALIVAAPQQAIMPSGALTVTARLLDAAGAALPDYNLYLHVADAIQRRTTDARGSVTFVIKKALDPGLHTLQVIFVGRGSHLPAQRQSVITVAPPAATLLTFARAITTAPAYVGDEIAYVAQLSSDSRPIPAAFVRFFVDGAFLRGANTDAEGKIELQLPRSLAAGSHVVSATLRATPNQAGAVVSASLLLLPRILELRTVPPLQGIQIRIGDAVLETDAAGVARTTVSTTGALTATVLPHQPPIGTVRVEFDRWSDGALSTTRKLRLTSDVTTTYQIGFNVSHPVILRFVEEAAGREVAPSRLGSILLITSAGEAISVSATSDGLQWLKANRIIRLEKTLLASPVSYQLRKVTVDGVNVVNEGQQRFKVAPNAHWTMRLQMHDLEVEVSDALLGTPLGKGLRVDYPGGDSRHVALDPAGKIRLESLSRGSYTVTVQEVQGIRSPMLVALSRNREVSIAVISYLDLVIVGGVMMFLAMAALLMGRRKALIRLLSGMR